MAIQDELEGEGGYTAESVISMYLSGLKKDCDGKRFVFNEGKVGQDRSGRGREFQMDGAANEKERRPFANRISGILRRNLSVAVNYQIMAAYKAMHLTLNILLSILISPL